MIFHRRFFFFPLIRVVFTGALLFSLPGISRATVTQEIPEPFAPSRYEAMVKKSPFALATPVAAPATPGFAANLYITGIAKIGSQDFVSISSRDQQSKFSLCSGDQPRDGVSLVSVEWSEQIGKSKVTIKKGTEFAVLEFDQAAIQSAASAAPQQIPRPPNLPNLPNMPVLPSQPQPPPSTRRIIQPNQSPGVDPAQQGFHGGRRIRNVPIGNVPR